MNQNKLNKCISSILCLPLFYVSGFKSSHEKVQYKPKLEGSTKTYKQFKFEMPSMYNVTLNLLEFLI